MINGMENLKTLELRETNITLDLSTINMIPGSVKNFKGTFCRGDLEESCDFAFAMQNLKNTSTMDSCFDRIVLTNGTKLTEKIRKCEEEKDAEIARIKAEKAAKMAQQNGIIAACSVLGLLFCSFLAWKYAIMPNLPWFYR